MDWKRFEIRTQPKKFDLPEGLGLWLDATDLNNYEGPTLNYNKSNWALEDQIIQTGLISLEMIEIWLIA